MCVNGSCWRRAEINCSLMNTYNICLLIIFSQRYTLRQRPAFSKVLANKFLVCPGNIHQVSIILLAITLLSWSLITTQLHNHFSRGSLPILDILNTIPQWHRPPITVTVIITIRTRYYTSNVHVIMTRNHLSTDDHAGTPEEGS